MPTLAYPVAAPVFADRNHMADIIGHARTADEAAEIYRRFYADTSETRTARAVKACPDRGKEGPVDGWVPEFS